VHERLGEKEYLVKAKSTCVSASPFFTRAFCLHPGVGGGTHRRRATFRRCQVRGVVLPVVVCGVVLVVCVCVTCVSSYRPCTWLSFPRRLGFTLVSASPFRTCAFSLHPGVGGGTHRRRATFDRCQVRGVVLRVVVCGVVLVVCLCV